MVLDTTRVKWIICGSNKSARVPQQSGPIRKCHPLSRLSRPSSKKGTMRDTNSNLLSRMWCTTTPLKTIWISRINPTTKQIILPKTDQQQMTSNIINHQWRARKSGDKIITIPCFMLISHLNAAEALLTLSTIQTWLFHFTLVKVMEKFLLSVIKRPESTRW